MALASVSGATGTVAAETVYPVMVNGYLCYSAAEVAAVRRGQSPDSVRPGNGGSSSASSAQDAAQAAADQQAQARALQEAQTRIAQFSQLQTQSPQDLEKLPRGSIVDIRA